MNFFLMKGKYVEDANAGEVVTLKGWVERVKELGKMNFLVLRDRSGTMQVTAKKGEVPDEVLEMIPKLPREACIAVKGKVIESKFAKSGIEMIPEKLEVISEAESPLPLDFSGKIDSEKRTRFDYRYLDLRNPEVQRIFHIRSSIIQLFREYFVKEGFIEIHSPVIQAAGAEGGSTLFKFDYYGKEAYLRQSPQLYKQMMMASGLDKIFEIGQVFRAEKFHTRRHLSEYLSTDFEMAWIDDENDVMDMLEGMVKHTLKGIKDIGIDVKVPDYDFPRLTYTEIIEMLKKEGIEIEWGEDLEDAQEAKLGEIMDKKGIDWYFITKYPSKIKPFYIMLDGELSRGLDLDYKGMEMASGGQREHRFDVLVKVMKEKGLNPDDFKFYTDAFRWGMPPHGGIGFGTERLVMQVLGLANVQEAILYPRTPEMLMP
ncbi:MAG: aspartate--tRNA(Asn) ligase [Candidatus Micrarchaeota archaeon]|nr:aspartate--tRNA(Asn) ligase [Candidatus Micrarchaeota archaeon]